MTLVWVWAGVWAGGLIHPTQAAMTQVLPQGRYKLGVIFARTGEIRDTYDDDGNPVSLVAPYQLELSSRNFRRAEPRVSELVNFLNNLPYQYDAGNRGTDNGIRSTTPGSGLPSLGDALSRGSLGVDAYGQREQWVFQFRRGITERFSLGIFVQVIQQSLTLKTQIGGINTANDIYQYFSGIGGTGQLGQFADGLGLLAQINTGTFQSVLESKGYDRFSDRLETGLGDLIIGGRYQWNNRRLAPGHFMAAFEGRLMLPTGKLARPSQLTGLDFGSGAVSVMAGHNVSLRLDGRWQDHATSWLPLVGKSAHNILERIEVYHNISITQNFPYERIRRIRANEGDFLPDASTEEAVTVALGNSWSNTVGASYQINPTLSFTAQLDWMFRNKDQILTAGPDTSRAEYLAQGTDGDLKTLQLQIAASSIGSFMRGGWPIPGELSFTWSQPLAGRNQILAPYGLAELALYF